MSLPGLTHEQRLVLCEMVRDRCEERAHLRRLLQYDTEFPQNRWNVLNDELTMLYVALGELKKRNPMNQAISDARKADFWQHCQAQFAKKRVAALKPVRELKYEPRTDPSIAFGD